MTEQTSVTITLTQSEVETVIRYLDTRGERPYVTHADPATIHTILTKLYAERKTVA